MHQFIGRQSLNNGSAELAERLVEEAGHQVVFLPKYSPDLNDIEHKSHDQARGLKTDRVPIIFINKYFTQFIPGKQEGYATTTK